MPIGALGCTAFSGSGHNQQLLEAAMEQGFNGPEGLFEDGGNFL